MTIVFDDVSGLHKDEAGQYYEKVSAGGGGGGSTSFIMRPVKAPDQVVVEHVDHADRDQEILDKLQQRAASTVTRAKETAAAVKELDDRTPPVKEAHAEHVGGGAAMPAPAKPLPGPAKTTPTAKEK